ncbi:hypothetical protein BGZ46_006986 [Entomortierella lignicola]|nr:hypothetical protein BGZ46_006986 [Entomortierella lignicola]
MAWIPAWTQRPPRPQTSAQRTSAGAYIPGTQQQQPAIPMPPGTVISQPHMLGVMPPPMHMPPPPTLAMLTATQRPQRPPGSSVAIGNPGISQRPRPPVPYFAPQRPAHIFPPPSTFMDIKCPPLPPLPSPQPLQLLHSPYPASASASAPLMPSRPNEIKAEIKGYNPQFQQEPEKTKKLNLEAKPNLIPQSGPGTHMINSVSEGDSKYVSTVDSAEQFKEKVNLAPEKLTKAWKRKEWQRKSIERMLEYRALAEIRRRQRSSTEIDGHPKHSLALDKKVDKKKKLTKKDMKQEKARKAEQAKQARALAQKLRQLKNLRQERMKRAGQLSSEEDNEYFETIRKAEKALQDSAKKKKKKKKRKKQDKESVKETERESNLDSKCADVKTNNDTLKDFNPKQNNVDTSGVSNAGVNPPEQAHKSTSTDSTPIKRDLGQNGPLVSLKDQSHPPAKMRKIIKGASPQQSPLQKQQSILTPVLAQANDNANPLKLQAVSSNGQRVTQRALSKECAPESSETSVAIRRRQIWESFRVTQVNGAVQKRRATSIPDGLGEPPVEPSNPEWAKYLLPNNTRAQGDN